jgi:hypothetical protein
MYFNITKRKIQHRIGSYLATYPPTPFPSPLKNSLALRVFKRDISPSFCISPSCKEYIFLLWRGGLRGVRLVKNLKWHFAHSIGCVKIDLK